MNIDICRKCPYWHETLSMAHVSDIDDDDNIVASRGMRGVITMRCYVTGAGNDIVLDERKSKIVGDTLFSAKMPAAKRGDGTYEKLHDLLGDEYEQLLKERMGMYSIDAFIWSRCEYHTEHVMGEWNEEKDNA